MFRVQAAQCCRQAVMSGITKCRLSRELQRTARAWLWLRLPVSEYTKS